MATVITNVTNFKKGDEVYGGPNFPGDGSYAEYVVAKASQFALKLKSISFSEASGVPLAGPFACNALFELGKLQAGQRVFKFTGSKPAIRFGKIHMHQRKWSCLTILWQI